MATTSNQLWQILEALVIKTQNRETVWEADPDLNFAFRTSIGGYLARIESVDGDERPPFRLAVLEQQDGSVVDVGETARARESSHAATMRRNGQLAELYHEARRQALGINVKLDQVARELGIE